VEIIPKVRTTYDPIKEIGAREVVQYTDGVYYCYGAEADSKYSVIAIVHDMPGKTWVVDAEQAVIDKLSSSVPYNSEPHPLFYIAVLAYRKYAVAIAPNPTGNMYAGHTVISRRPASRTWTEFRNIEFQIAPTDALDDRRVREQEVKT
jgi:hypothetical protein